MTPDGLARLQQDEGLRCQPYDDRSGVAIKLGPQGGKVTIGYGRNLTDRPLTGAEASWLLQNDLAEMWSDLTNQTAWLATLPGVWQDVVLMVQYNTGEALAFHQMLSAMQNGDAQTAAAELMNSRAARELPARYGRMRDAILAGTWG
jgi:lysozyme